MFGTCDNCKLFIEKSCDTYSNYELDENKRCKNFEALKKRKCDDCFYFNKDILFCRMHQHYIGDTKNYDCLAYKKDNTPKDWEKVKFVPEIIMEEYNKMKTNTKHDPVNHPNHYTSGGIECIDCIKAALGENFIGFLIGNVIKYCYRYRNKNGVQDLRKAQWYLEKAIKELEENNKKDEVTMTNADRIRQMTDEELVDILYCNQCIYQGMPECEPNDCEYGILAWLKQEVNHNAKMQKENHERTV